MNLAQKIEEALIEQTYNTKMKRIEKIEQETKSAATNDYIQSLKNKYKNN